MSGFDFPAIEIYYYSIAGMEEHEITPIRFLRTCKRWRILWGEGGWQGSS